MEASEATKLVFQKIQNLDPENVSKIMGILLIQDHSEKEMIRLAFAPESLLHSVVLKTRKELGFSSNSLATPSTLSSPLPFGDSIYFSRQKFSSSATTSRILGGRNLPSPHSMTSKNGHSSTVSSAWGGGCSLVNDLPHRKSCYVSDICFKVDDPSGGLGLKPCLYFARGYCKNGSSCRFLHDASHGEAEVRSPRKLEMMEHCQELLKSKSAHQQRLATASQLVASSNFSLSPMASNKCINFLQQQQLQSTESPRATTALMIGDNMHKLSTSHFEREEFGLNGGAGIENSCSKKIYLTFSGDNTFKEEDIFNYFSTFGPVQNVRIPYQQKWMFGFVTFVYPETVKTILAKGNPHFVGNSRLIVKPYKERGKVLEKFRRQHQ